MVAALMALSLLAKVRPIVHYNFGKLRNVTYAVAPKKLTSLAGKGELVAVGHPVFYADAPGDKKMKGESDILFNDNGDGYKLVEAVGFLADNQMFAIIIHGKGNYLLLYGKAETRNFVSLYFPQYIDATCSGGFVGRLCRDRPVWFERWK